MYRVGYAFDSRKFESFIVDSFLECAKQRGIDLVQIHTDRSLIEQGPFDCVIHKLYDEDWKKQLAEFSALHPNTPIIDRPESIERLHNRISMLEVVTQLKISLGNDTVWIPKQAVIHESKALDDDANAIEELGLKFPLIAKPLMANGSDSSHKLCLVFDREGLKTLSVPVVLQEFVNHGGVIFKVYVAGQHVKCVKRKSLPDIAEEKLETLRGSVPFSQISNLAVEDGDDSVESNIERAEMPAGELVVELGRALREAMGLNLFNVDMIRDGSRYLVIDINYFPGYSKLPAFESFFTDFLWDVVHKESGIAAFPYSVFFLIYKLDGAYLHARDVAAAISKR
ncbi:inositol-tetrakisphosphate 1-kinase 1 [Senna tora]|uniref:Inositol-tetrakisphosphate 1-kinase n=1 Tax=Senna tora TaxID=362788 RepID=A0A834SMM8_9FABA|nr:inositol-tetrakisphosphate 1-kinase 1 [Senna tora]